MPLAERSVADVAAERASEASAPAARARPAWLADALPLAALLLLALALRLPSYQTVPGFSDEVGETAHSLRIVQGEPLLLTDLNPYDGSLWNYLVIASFLVSGFNLHAPRTVVLIVGVLTVLATYPLGRAWSGGSRLGGLLAAGLLATSAVHIVVNSRIAWSNCLTPLFTTLGAWAVWRVGRREAEGWGGDGRREAEGGGSGRAYSGLRTQDSGPVPGLRTQDSGLRTRPGTQDPGLGSACLVGLTWGLAFQTHPSVIGLLPGVGLYLLLKAPRLLWGRWAVVAALAFLLANLNLVVYNLGTGLGSLSEGLDKSAAYTGGERLTPRVYVRRLGLLGQGLLQNLAGALDLRDDQDDYLLDPGLWPIALLTLAALAWQWRRGNPLPTLLVLSMALMLPIFNDKYRPILNGRYLAPLLPIAYAAAASVLARGTETPRLRLPSPAALRLLTVLLVVFLFGHPLVYLRTFYDQAVRVGRTNTVLFQLLDQIKGVWRGGDPILVDKALELRRIGWGSGWVGSALELSLTLEGIPTRSVDPGSDGLLRPESRCREQLLVLDGRTVSREPELVARLDVRELDGRPARPIGQQGYRLLRLPRAGAC